MKTTHYYMVDGLLVQFGAKQDESEANSSLNLKLLVGFILRLPQSSTVDTKHGDTSSPYGSIAFYHDQETSVLHFRRVVPATVIEEQTIL